MNYVDLMNMSCAVDDWDMADFWEDMAISRWCLIRS